MKSMAEILKAQNRVEQAHDEIDHQTAEVIDKLFNDLLGACPAFQQAWPTPDIMESAKRIWTKVFIERGITDGEQLKNGIIKLASMSNPFVPTAGQFIDLCQENKVAAPYHRDYVALPSRPSSREVALSHLAQMKELLRQVGGAWVVGLGMGASRRLTGVVPPAVFVRGLRPGGTVPR